MYRADFFKSAFVAPKIPGLNYRPVQRPSIRQEDRLAIDIRENFKNGFKRK